MTELQERNSEERNIRLDIYSPAEPGVGSIAWGVSPTRLRCRTIPLPLYNPSQTRDHSGMRGRLRDARGAYAPR